MGELITQGVPPVHGSIERLPGNLFRAMGDLFLQKKGYSREALSHELQEHLETIGVDYHVRTLKRQLTGRIASVPPEVQGAMRHVLIQANGLRTDFDIEKALRGAGLWVAPEERQPEYLSTERIVPLGQLWLLFNPTHSRRFLATTLSRRLALQGVRLKVDPLQNILTGRQPLARRVVYDVLLSLLSPHGVASEAEALARWQERQKEIAAYIEDRTLEPAERLANLATAWKLRKHQPSSRHLSAILQEKLRQRGIDLCLSQIQKGVDGRFKLVRRALIVEMEGMLRESLPDDQDLATEVAAAAQKPIQQIDLCWVEAEPIAALAQSLVEQHPGTTMRQLSIRVTKTARRMGYATSPSTVQPILGGHKKRTRGFVYRAMLKQFERHGEARIPEEHILKSLRQASQASHDCPVDPEKKTPEREGAQKKSSLKDYLSRAKDYLPEARSRAFLPFVAFRAERLFGIPRDKAQARILGRRRPVSTIPPDEESEEEFPHGPSDDDAESQEIQATLKKVGS